MKTYIFLCSSAHCMLHSKHTSNFKVIWRKTLQPSYHILTSKRYFLEQKSAIFMLLCEIVFDVFLLYLNCESSPANLMDRYVMLMNCPQVNRMLLLLGIAWKLVSFFSSINGGFNWHFTLTEKRGILNRTFIFMLYGYMDIFHWHFAHKIGFHAGVE